MPEQVDDPLIGKVLSDRFEIVAPIGVGGMGRVYKAVQRPLDRIVALKVLNPRYDGSKDPGFEKRFFLEASMTAKLKHPNTITVHDYGRTDDGIFYIAMEYVEGETLQQVLSHGRLAWQRSLFIGAQIARSLREAHKLGLVHRDLKPANIMLINEGTGGDIVKVLDFGLVKSFMGVPSRSSTGELPGAEPENRAEITQAGVLLGSPMYMAPEQARNEADQRTDVYALGVLLFQTMAGRPPFVGRESIDVIVKHIREKPPELRTLVPDLPFEVNALIMKCLEKDPRARFQSMEELLEAMRVATQGQGISGVFSDPRTSSNSQNPRANSSANVVVHHDQATPGSTRVAEALKPDSVAVEFVVSGEQQLPRGRLIAMIIGITLLGVVVGGGVAWSLTHPQAKAVTVSPAPAPVAPEVPKPVAPTPARVTFVVTSQPPGATVTHQGAVLGLSPVRFSAELGADAEARETFTVALDGYQPVTLTARGTAGVVPVDVSLEKSPPAVVSSPATRPSKNPKQPKNPKPENPPGYKDDPYQ